MQKVLISFDPDLAHRHRDLRECFATCVYSRGLCKAASALDVAPSNLSQMLSGERNLDVALIEKYMAEFKDTTPATYLAARWLQDQAELQQQAIAKLPGMLDELHKVLNLVKAGET
jgi:hypothetical protein